MQSARLAMFKAFAKIVSKAAEPSAAYVDCEAVETSGEVGVDMRFAGLGHGASLPRTSAIWTSKSRTLSREKSALGWVSRHLIAGR